MKYLAIILVLISTTGAPVLTFAEDNLHPTAGGAADMLGVTNAPPEISGARPDDRAQITMTCTDRDGRKLQSGDNGFEQCMRDSQKQNKASASGTLTPAGNSVK